VIIVNLFSNSNQPQNIEINAELLYTSTAVAQSKDIFDRTMTLNIDCLVI